MTAQRPAESRNVQSLSRATTTIRLSFIPIRRRLEHQGKRRSTASPSRTPTSARWRCTYVRRATTLGRVTTGVHASVSSQIVHRSVLLHPRLPYIMASVGDADAEYRSIGTVSFLRITSDRWTPGLGSHELRSMQSVRGSRRFCLGRYLTLRNLGSD